MIAIGERISKPGPFGRKKKKNARLNYKLIMERDFCDMCDNLSYNKFDKDEAKAELFALSKRLIPDKDNGFSQRFLEIATIIEANLCLFHSVCPVDVVTNIIEYLNYYGVKFKINKLDKLEEEQEVMAVMNTLFNICTQVNIHSFLSISILTNSDLENSEKEIYNQMSCQYKEAIVFDGSDLYAAGDVLEKYDFNVIWVQQPLAEKFTSSVIKFHHLIRVFRSKQELLDFKIPKAISITSIWSENIVATKNFAASLNRDVVFINSFMHMPGGVTLLPCMKELDKDSEMLIDKSASTTKPDASEHSFYNLFYDGMWQEPVQNTYWLHNDILWADATNDDIKRCMSAAEKGAQLWSSRSVNARMQVLSKLVTTLHRNNNSLLANIILNWKKLWYFYKNSIQECSQNERMEVTIIRKPLGIVVLKAHNLNTLFQQLTFALLTGNSVIVLCNAEYATLARFCDMFSTSGIPPGVINMLSIKNVKNVLQKYYISELELITEEKNQNPYIKLTKPEIIILPLK